MKTKMTTMKKVIKNKWYDDEWFKTWIKLSKNGEKVKRIGYWICYNDYDNGGICYKYINME